MKFGVKKARGSGNTSDFFLDFFKDFLKYFWPDVKVFGKPRGPALFIGARENKGMGAENRGILLFRFLTSNETEKYQ